MAASQTGLLKCHETSGSGKSGPLMLDDNFIAVRISTALGWVLLTNEGIGFDAHYVNSGAYGIVDGSISRLMMRIRLVPSRAIHSRASVWRRTIRRVEAQRIPKVHRIVSDIGIDVQAPFHPDRIGLHEPAHRGIIDAGTIVSHAELRHPSLPGIAEPPRQRTLDIAIFVIAIDRRHHVAAGVRHRHHAAPLVGVEPAARRGA